MTELEARLKRLPEPQAPAHLKQTILARVAQVDDSRAGAVDESHPSVTAAAAGTVTPAPDRLAWALALTGIIIGMAAQLYRWYLGEVTLDILGPRIPSGPRGIASVMTVTPAAALLATGLLLYLAGLFAPWPRGRRTP